VKHLKDSSKHKRIIFYIKVKEIKMAEEVNKQEELNEEEIKTTAQAGKIVWNDREMVSTYSNVCNIAASNDEFMFLFGTSEAWNSAQKNVLVNLKQRIIMTPSSAKKFHELLTKTIEEYDKKQQK